MIWAAILVTGAGFVGMTVGTWIGVLWMRKQYDMLGVARPDELKRRKRRARNTY